MALWTPGPGATDGNDTYVADSGGGYAFALAGNDTLTGAEGDDQLEGGLGDDSIDGGAGSNDYVSYFQSGGPITVNLALTGPQATGIDGLDTIVNVENIWGSFFSDTLTGNDGNNLIEGFGGNDTMDGGAGLDQVSYFNAGAGVTVNLSLTTAQDTGGEGIDTLSNFEDLYGSNFVDVLTGNGGDNRINGAGGNDRIDGGDGTDVLSGGDGDDTLIGGNGYDTADYFFAAAAVKVNLAATTPQATGGAGTDTLSGIEAILGSAFNDTLTGGNGDDQIEGAAGDDRLNGGAGMHDRASYFNAPGAVTVNLGISGPQNTVGDGTDTLTNFENIYGSRFGDTLTGSGAANDLSGDAGDDTLNGAGGNDTLNGGSGNDVMKVDSAGDVVNEAVGGGNDLVETKVSYTLTAGQEIETLVTAAPAATMALNLTGNEFANTIRGNAGINILTGGDGNDSLFSGSGNDHLNGGLGRDTLDPGTGSDVFDYTAVAESTGANRDVILGFRADGRDRINLPTVPTGIDANLTQGILRSASFDADLRAAVGATKLAAGHAVLFDPSNGDLNVAGHVYLVVDANGIAGYQPGKDYVFELVDPAGGPTADWFV
ncbi:MAG: hypothetical protein IT548_17315 [Alphaproteobacteria bacterium]|nr:hypothetical protein [Alphaproteobacteria bacterium]